MEHQDYEILLEKTGAIHTYIAPLLCRRGLDVKKTELQSPKGPSRFIVDGTDLTREDIIKVFNELGFEPIEDAEQAKAETDTSEVFVPTMNE